MLGLNRLESVKAMVASLLNQLKEDDFVGLFGFDAGPFVIFPGRSFVSMFVTSVNKELSVPPG